MTGVPRYANPYKIAATAYSRLGFAPIPVHADGARAKTPAVKGHHGRDAKWPSMDTVEMWERTRGEYNVAIVLPRDVIGIDVDGYAGHAGSETLVELERELGPLPPTYISTARDDGISGIRLYHVPDDIEWPGKAGDGIDVICWYERYVICWPSWHSGVKDIYRWWQQTKDGPIPTEFPDPDFLPNLPQAWVDHLARVAGGPTPRSRVTDIVGWLRENGAGEMCRQTAHTLSHWLGRMAEARDAGGIHDDARDGVKALLGDCAAGHTGLWKALVRLRSAFLEAIATRSRKRNGPEEWRGFVAGGVAITDPIMTGAKDTCGQEAGLPTREDIERSRRSVLLTGYRTGTWLDKQEFPPIKWAIPGLVPEGLTILAGKPKAGKSILLLRAALECARAGTVLNLDVDPHNVFYLALEDSLRRMQQRSRELLDGRRIPKSFGFQIELYKPGKLIETVTAWLEKNGPGLVLIDTLGAAMEDEKKGEGTYGRDNRIVKALKSVIDSYPGAAGIASTHTRKKTADDWLDTVTGTNAIAGGADTIMVLSRQRSGSEGLLQVTGRDVEEAEYGVILDRPSGWRLDGDDLDAAVESAYRRNAANATSGKMGELVAFVDESEVPVDRDMAADALGISPAQASVYLSRGHDRGHIRRLERGKYGSASKMTMNSQERASRGSRGPVS